MAFRPEARSGIWCCFVLPVALWSSFDSSDGNLRLVSAVMAALFAFVAVFTLKDAYKGSLRGLLFAITDNDEIQSIADPSWKCSITAVAAVWIFSWLITTSPAIVKVLACASTWFMCKTLPAIFTAFPRSFTFGEGVILVQGLYVFYFEALVSLALDRDDPTTIEGSFGLIARVGTLSCLTVCLLPQLPRFRRFASPSLFLPLGFTTLAGLTLPFLWYKLKRDPIGWVLDTVTSSGTKWSLLILWTTCSLTCFVLVGMVASGSSGANTRTRKWFHLLVVVVFTTGLLADSDPCFLYLGSVASFCLLLLLEAMRFYRVPIFASLLDAHLSTFLSESERGSALITVHLYMLAGCSVPLWLASSFFGSSHTVRTLRLLSGVLSTGVGDSAASVVGSLFGRIKYPASNKTVEGTLACVAAQLMFTRALEYLGFVMVPDWNAVAMAVIAVSAVEAWTTQTDNLILPLILYILI